MLFSERLPPVQSLVVFEAAARHLSFTGAARELGTTQSAVSQQVRALETQLELSLFTRVYRGVELTEEGRILKLAVEEGFHRIAAALEQLQFRRQHQRLDVATDFALAAYWLMPRLPSFRALHPEVDVRLVTSQNWTPADAQEVDVAIAFFGQPPWVAGTQLLFAETVFPICSPAFLADLGELQAPDELADVPLLGLRSAQGAGWLDWSRVMASLGAARVPGEPVLTFDNYTLLIQAALSGQGVGLGWGTLVDDLIERGLLVAMHQFTVSTEGGYFLIEPKPHEPVNAKRHFIQWLLDTQQTDDSKGVPLAR
ncbi:transcriptional regulator [Marinobacterium zhoushanense]|uniref:Transcriptional regulator n=1 Tax=Marinobacterium zhoushanense TaxID=1679163 RepID=A0ABQ1KCS0_9GAMM|nr:LysR substrate-binding domain-containing protein [Marinobacterium zhoushanense]GGB95940.1 transcriptional regulator [Marinobacterium zhoushanense]